MTLTLCPEAGCGAAMEWRKDKDGPFYHCRNCGMDWDAEDMHEPTDGSPDDFGLDESRGEDATPAQVAAHRQLHEPTVLEGYCRGCGDPASKHEGSFCPDHYSTVPSPIDHTDGGPGE